MSTFELQPFTPRSKKQADQEHKQMWPHPKEVAELVLLARAAHWLHLGNRGWSQAVSISWTLIFLNDSVVVDLEKVQSRWTAFYLIPYFTLGWKVLTFLSVFLDPNSLISYFARSFLPWMFLKCSCDLQFTIFINFSMLHTSNSGSRVFTFESYYRLSWKKKKHYDLDG